MGAVEGAQEGQKGCTGGPGTLRRDPEGPGTPDTPETTDRQLEPRKPKSTHAKPLTPELS